MICHVHWTAGESKQETEMTDLKVCDFVYFNVPEGNQKIISEKMKPDFEFIIEASKNEEVYHEVSANIFRIGEDKWCWL